MIENCIITPTYKGHFPFIKKYLKTYVHFVEDAHEVPVFFIISRNESNEFKKLISPFTKKANLQVLYFEDILSEYGIEDDSDTLLKKYGRYSFQTLKKMYAIKFIDANHFLVLDSESLWIKTTNMTQIFKLYFEAPFVIYTKNTDRKPTYFMNKMVKNVSSVLDKRIDFWTIESNMWFIEKRIFSDMEKNLGTPIDWANTSLISGSSKQLEENGLMEALLYQTWLVINSEKYGYKAINTFDVLHKYCTNNEIDCYISLIDKYFSGGVGVFEDLLVGCYDIITQKIINIINSIKLTVVRCDFSDLSNYKRQKIIVRNSCIHILACSQNNIFTYSGPSVIKLFLKRFLLFSWDKYRKILYKISPIYCLEVRNSKKLEKIDERLSQIEFYLNNNTKES